MSLKSWSPDPTSPDWRSPDPMFLKPRSPPGAAKGPGSPGYPRDGAERSCDQQSHPIQLWRDTARATTLRGGRARGSRGFPHLLVSAGSRGRRYLEIRQRPHPGWMSCPGGQGCAQQDPSQGHKQLKGLRERRPGITHTLRRPLAEWEGAGLALESQEDLPANPYGASSWRDAWGGGQRG